MICIDPGHGGSDPGAVVGVVREKDLALTYGLSLGGELCQLGLTVRYTRTRDASQSLSDRAQIANVTGAKAFVSVHFNASNNPTASGIWLIHAKGAPGGKGLAEALHRELGGTIHTDASPSVGYTKAANEAIAAGKAKGLSVADSLSRAGITQPYRTLTVLRRTTMPAVLIEYGFLTNAAERVTLQSVERLRALIARTAIGIKGWAS